MYSALGYGEISDEAWAERIAAAEHLALEVYAIADALVSLNPE
jgi:hypothetical protein